ncbi:MAG TPA: hypothetical protein VEX37_16110, partial [Thermomicrobiales bacterium]|nr:hypothetical protein [Thermomicrobiales bacterium]
TMRTFHTGGVSHADDITTGLPRVEELFEARDPKGKAVLSEIEGIVEIVTEEESRKIIIRNRDLTTERYDLGSEYVPAVKDGEKITRGQSIATSANGNGGIISSLDGLAVIDTDSNALIVQSEVLDEKEYTVPHTAHVRVQDGDRVNPGDQLMDGNLDPQEVLTTRGREAVQRLLVDEVQKVYKSQGVVTNDKHIETIVRQMLRKVSIDDPGDTDLLPGELADRFAFNAMNAEMLAQGGEPATAQEMLLGITKASLATDSFLSAASFQETTRVLTEAAINGKIDSLRGLKENVIIGKLIPAGTGFNVKPGGIKGMSSFDEAAMLAAGELREVEPASIEDVEELASSTNAATTLAVDTFDPDDSGETVADDPAELEGADAGDLALSNLFAEEEDDQPGLEATDGEDNEDDPTTN